MRNEFGNADVWTLLSFVPDDKKQEVSDYIDAISKDERYMFDADHTFVGFMGDYINYADILVQMAKIQMIGNPFLKKRGPPLIVYDVGCSTALQHIVFDPMIHYVGIDYGQPEPMFFRENCSYVEGKFSEVLEKLNINPYTSVGIANMSLLYGLDDSELKVFDKVFRRKFVR